jgi:hypothetical protein
MKTRIDKLITFGLRLSISFHSHSHFVNLKV